MLACVCVCRVVRQNILVNVGMSGEEKVDEAKVEMEEGEVRPAHARHLRWGNAEEVRELMQDLETGYFDVVLGSDLIYPQDVSHFFHVFSVCVSPFFFRNKTVLYV